MSQTPTVSFVVPCHQCAKTLDRTLRSIAAQDYAAVEEVLVVTADPLDPGSLAAAFASSRLVPLTHRQPAGTARNIGAREATGDLLAFVDADVQLPPGWLSELVAVLEHNPSLAGSGAPVGNANPARWQSRVLHWLEFSEFLPGCIPGARPFLSSSNLLVRSEAFQASGAFDEDLEMSEDLELCNRLAPLWMATSAVSHRHREEWPAVRDHLGRLGYWSGRLRASGRLRGSWLARARWLCVGLPFYRLGRILTRTFQAGPGTGIRSILHAPVLLLGLCFWTGGFYRGLHSREP